MVFQNYALYPHYKVRDNIGYPLRRRRVPKAEIDKRVHEVAAMLDVERLLDRWPRQLSGGERQRVALGRAIIRNPSVFLMDEPLSNLDAKLRVQMRREIIRLQRVLGTTTIYVTHDQVEAMTMGDRIMVLRFGRIQQVGPAGRTLQFARQHVRRRLHRQPGDERLPRPAGGDAAGLTLVTRSGRLPLPPQIAARLRADGAAAAGPREVMWGIRAEDIRLGPAPAAGGDGLDMRATVDLVEGLGSDAYVSLALSGDNIVARTPADARPAENETVGRPDQPEQAPSVRREDGRDVVGVGVRGQETGVRRQETGAPVIPQLTAIRSLPFAICYRHLPSASNPPCHVHPSVHPRPTSTPRRCAWRSRRSRPTSNGWPTAFRDSPVRLRPHAKTHKCPTLARMQLAAGAIGITCAKLGEAEVMAAAGIKDILIANQIIGAGKIARLVNLAAYTEVMVAVDDAANVAELDAAAQAKGVRLRVVIEVDIGMARCGVQPGEPALALARAHRGVPRPALRGGDGVRGPHDLPPRPGGAPRSDRTQRQAAGGHRRPVAA